MTVDELIAALQRASKAGYGSTPVETEGCDCWGDADDLIVVGKNDILITRQGSWEHSLISFHKSVRC